MTRFYRYYLLFILASINISCGNKGGLFQVPPITDIPSVETSKKSEKPEKKDDSQKTLIEENQQIIEAQKIKPQHTDIH